jgi:hypothetical protein
VPNDTPVKAAFEKASKIFFWAAGVVTALGALPMMLSPVAGLRLVTGLSYFDQSPQMSPIVGHWGTMVVGMGVLLFVSAANKQIRKTTVIFSTLEKAYMVAGAPYAGNYVIPLIGDSLMVAGGICYLVQSRRLGQA